MVFEKYDLAAIEEAFQALQEIAKTKVMPVLFVFDDMIDQNVMHPQQMGTIEAIAVRGRHYNISIIMISQLYKKLSNPMRVNSTNSIFFRIRNRNELEKVVEENQESLSKKSFLKIYNFCTSEPYGFLHVNNQEPDPAKRFRKNWNTIIQINPTFSQSEYSLISRKDATFLPNVKVKKTEQCQKEVNSCSNQSKCPSSP